VEEVAVGRESYQVHLETDEDSGWFVAEVAGLPGCITQGRTVHEALANSREAIGLWLEAREDLAQQGIQVKMKLPGRRKGVA
jgi:predicted RNase H-like HicB family nuclease